MRTIKMDKLNSGIIDDIKNNRTFVYPTDTIYGIGCNALDNDAVKRIYAAKKRHESMALSVIAPSLKWISIHCDVDMALVRKYLPGPYTLIVKKKDAEFLSSVSRGKDTLGIRIIEHPIMKYFRMAGVPFVTTSVNVSGDAPICDIYELPKEICKFIDIAIDDNKISGKPSKIIDLSAGKEKIIGR